LASTRIITFFRGEIITRFSTEYTKLSKVAGQKNERGQVVIIRFPAARFLIVLLPPGILAARLLAAVILPPLVFFAIINHYKSKIQMSYAQKRLEVET